MATPLNNCVIARPDPRKLWNEIANKFSSTVLGGADIIPESNEFYVTSLLYAMSEEYYAYGDQLLKETDPRTACCANLRDIAERWGMYPLPATYAEGYVLITGNPGAALVDPLEMQSAGHEYRSAGTVPARLNNEGRATVRFRALEAGPASNLTPSDMGRLTNAPSGVDPEVQILGGQFCGGSTAESCEQFRQRFLDRMAYKPKATQAWLKEKIMEWPCVTRVCDRAGNCCDPEEDECCPDTCKENLGNEFYVFMDGTFECGVPPQCVLDEIQDWLFGPSPRQGRGLGEAPINVCGRLISPTPAAFNVNIDVNACLTPNQEAAIEEAIEGFMLQVCPSVDIQIQQLLVVVGQVLGPLAQFDIWLQPTQGSAANGWLTRTSCGLEVACDVMPCIDNINIMSPTPPADDCGAV